MLLRNFSIVLERYLHSFPAVLVLGARQVGKTTLLKQKLAATHSYVLLEDPDMRELANQDPRSFLAKFPPPVIFDEFQNAPGLVNYLQSWIDSNRDTKGQIVLTGSQNFLMMNQVSQSLAGRIGILSLHGLSSDEIPKATSWSSSDDIARLILRGTYPELWKSPEIRTRDWMSSYVQTFLERDLRQLAQVGDLATFERFLKLTAARTSQVLNLSDLARDCGVSSPTIQKWLSILERGYVVRLVPPYLSNLSSRIRKSSKLYFLDTGLAAYLMGFRDEASLLQSPQIGALFENLVYADFIKRTSSIGEIPDHYFLQTKSKVGVDLVIEQNRKLHLVEVKWTRTFSSKLCEQLLITAQALHEASQNGNKPTVERLTLVMPVDNPHKTIVTGHSIHICNWNGAG
jgi:predicted AAA+ superfamily ATPase